MRAVVVALAVGSMWACTSKRDVPEASSATPAPIKKELPAANRSMSYATQGIRATHIERNEPAPAIYAVAVTRQLDDVLLAMGALTGRFKLASQQSSAELPWLFGVDDKTVMEKLDFKVITGGIQVGEDTIQLGEMHEKLGKLLDETHARTSLPLSVSLSIESRVGFIQFAELLDFLGEHGVRSVTLLPLEVIRPSYNDTTVGRGYVPSISIGQPSANGGDLDKAIIRRYMKRNIQKLQYCYEKELLNAPTLAGTVVVQFAITPDGTVSSSAASGVSPAVSTCMASVVKAIEFPKPKDGQGVMVNYPFTVRPAG